jgi:hypothetical protein
MLTHDGEQSTCYDSDPLIFRQIAVNVLLDLHDTAKRLGADAGAIQTPTLMIADAYRAIFHETNRRDVIGLVHDFVRDCFAKATSTPSLVNADKTGYTAQEDEVLKNNGSARFAFTRAGLKIAGRLSRGINIGWRYGFDSGLSLDYVYKKEPHGWSPLGRVIDKSYLNSIGRRGIRQRKANLNKILRGLILKVHRENRPVRILDIAAGAGRYVIETIRDMPEIAIGATLCDYKQENVDAGRALADELNVGACRGDAFESHAFGSAALTATFVAMLATFPAIEIPEDTELSDLDLTGWECANQFEGTAQGQDARERNRMKNRWPVNLSLFTVESLDAPWIFKKSARV